MSVSTFFNIAKTKPSTIDRNEGFTLIELLIVIIVIGILATILIVGGNSYFHKTADSATQSSLERASRKFDAYKLKNGRYSPAALSDFKSEDNVTVTNIDTNNDSEYETYCLKATSTKYDDITYYVDNKGNVSQTSCATPNLPPPETTH